MVFPLGGAPHYKLKQIPVFPHHANTSGVLRPRPAHSRKALRSVCYYQTLVKFYMYILHCKMYELYENTNTNESSVRLNIKNLVFIS